MITIIYRNFPNVKMIFGKTFLSGHLIKFLGISFSPFLIFFLNFSHDAKGSRNPSTYPSWGSDIKEEKLRLEASIPRKLEDGWDPMIKIKLNNFSCYALCDVGASTSVMPKRMYDMLELKPLIL